MLMIKYLNTQKTMWKTHSDRGLSYSRTSAAELKYLFETILILVTLFTLFTLFSVTFAYNTRL